MIINGNIITADDDKILIRKSDGLVFGHQLELGYTWYIGGKLLSQPHLEVPEDYIDGYEIVLDDTGYRFCIFEKEYGEIKSAVVKLRYSPEDQIAILCNIGLDPENEYYKQRYDDMQVWREYAGKIAEQYSKY